MTAGKRHTSANKNRKNKKANSYSLELLIRKQLQVDFFQKASVLGKQTKKKKFHVHVKVTQKLPTTLSERNYIVNLQITDYYPKSQGSKYLFTYGAGDATPGLMYAKHTLYPSPKVQNECKVKCYWLFHITNHFINSKHLSF